MTSVLSTAIFKLDRNNSSVEVQSQSSPCPIDKELPCWPRGYITFPRESAAFRSRHICGKAGCDFGLVSGGGSGFSRSSCGFCTRYEGFWSPRFWIAALKYENEDFGSMAGVCSAHHLVPQEELIPSLQSQSSEFRIVSTVGSAMCRDGGEYRFHASASLPIRETLSLSTMVANILAHVLIGSSSEYAAAKPPAKSFLLKT